MVRGALAVLLLPLLVVPDAAAIDTDPGLSPSFALFPGPQTVQRDLGRFADHPWVQLRDLGTSPEGRAVRYAVVTDPTSTVPMDERVVTFVFTQQHGNEPAGTPAALALLESIASGDEVATTLHNQVLLLLPMANPDGAALNQRGNANETDINRDHMHLETPEANLLHTILNDWDVHVAVDHHEYGGTGLGNPSPVRLYDYDLTTMYANHGNVRTPTTEMAQRLMYEGMWPAAEAAGFTANEYGEETVAGVPLEDLPDEVEGPLESVAGPMGQIAGGPDPGIMRNHLGLHNIAGILVETRIDAHDNPFHDAARRTAIHAVTMWATLAYVSENAAAFRAAKDESAALNRDEPMDEYIEGDRRAPLAAAYLTGPSLGDLFGRHGLHPGHAHPDGLVHNTTVPLAGHVAALVHPESSRAVEAGVAVDPVDAQGDDVRIDETPLALVPLFLTTLALGVLALRRR